MKIVLRKTAKRVYLDHAAATPVDKRVLQAMLPYEERLFGNPGAIHQEGMIAKDAVETARKEIAGVLGAQPNEIIFTGSATESINLAMRGVLTTWKNTHAGSVPEIIISAVEHAAVYETARALEREGAILTILPVNKEGLVDARKLYSQITQQTALVSVMYANNEIGTIQPIHEIAKALRKWRKDHASDFYPLFHTDACQAQLALDLNVQRLGVDMMTLNAAKIYGPKGIAVLWKRRSVQLSPIITGGGQEFGLRSGTEDVPRIVGFARALLLNEQLKEQESLRVAKVCAVLLQSLKQHVPEAVVNGSIEVRLPNNLNISIPAVDHEFIVIALDSRGFAVSTKSACNEFEAEISHVLLALRNAGAHPELPASGIRISLGRNSQSSDMQNFAKTLRSILDELIVRIAE